LERGIWQGFLLTAAILNREDRQIADTVGNYSCMQRDRLGAGLVFPGVVLR